MTSAGMATAQPQLGVLAFGTTHHVYLELDRLPGTSTEALQAVVQLVEDAVPTGAGAALVIGFRPEIWRGLAAADFPVGFNGYNEPVVGDDGFTMPATQHDLLIWVAAGSRDVVFDIATTAIAELAGAATVAEESEGWSYRQHRDLTGFEDGTENPALSEVSSIAFVPAGQAGAGGSWLLLQRWLHDAAAWSELSVTAQERAIGRTKVDSLELDPKPDSSHAARTDQDEIGKIVRRNFPYGSVTKHGTMFVGLCNDREVLHEMLRRMAGIGGEPRDELTRFTSAETGAYYFLPSQDDLLALRS